MREALRALTVRGRAFLGAGVTAVVGSALLGQTALMRAGVLALALPVVTAAFLARGRYHLSLARTVSPPVVSAGQVAKVSITLTNEGRTPSGVLLLEDRIPPVLGDCPRFVLDGIGHGWRRHVSYQLSSPVRGHYDIGPMSVRVTDGFGLVQLVRDFRTAASLTVTPATVPLPTIPLGGAWTGSGDNRPRAFASGGAEDVTVREYRQGDELRRVHWRSSARVGELMVRREEQPWQSRAVLFLDNRVRAHRGAGTDSSLEAAVSAAASIAVHLAHRGFTVRLVTASGEEPHSAWHFRDADLNTTALLEALAVVPGVHDAHLDTRWLAEGPQGGLTVGVFGSVEAMDLPVLRRMRHRATSAMAVALRVDDWRTDRTPRTSGTPGNAITGGPALGAGSAGPSLTQAGWRWAGLGAQDRLDAVWQELGRGGSTTGLGQPMDALVPAGVAPSAGGPAR